MAKRKYTLPRHTNLASQGSRIGAFLIDLAITLAIALGFFFGCFQFVFKFKTAPLEKRIKEERISSALFFEDEKGNLTYYGSTSDNQDFKDALVHFYTVYIPSNYEEGKDDFNAEWVNTNVLKIEGDGRAYFDYVKVGDEVDKTKVGVFKAEALEKDSTTYKNANIFLQDAWVNANYNLNHLPSFRALNNEFTFFYSLGFVISSLIATSIVYIVIPIFLKNGATVGKKVFGLCLADIDGYTIRNPQLLMRVMPVDILILALLIPIWNSMMILFIVILVFFLVSFTLAMASPKRCSLHDFTGRTIVVNAKTSILFSTVADEEAYIAKEDNIELDNNEHEEPELKYER